MQPVQKLLRRKQRADLHDSVQKFILIHHPVRLCHQVTGDSRNLTSLGILNSLNTQIQISLLISHIGAQSNISCMPSPFNLNGNCLKGKPYGRPGLLYLQTHFLQ